MRCYTPDPFAIGLDNSRSFLATPTVTTGPAPLVLLLAESASMEVLAVVKNVGFSQEPHRRCSPPVTVLKNNLSFLFSGI